MCRQSQRVVSEVVEDGVKFDTVRCIVHLQGTLVIALKAMQQLLMAESSQNMIGWGRGKQDLYEGDPVMLAGYLSCAIIGGPWATMDEWGTGSLMDMGNNSLAEYIGSDRWNVLRNVQPGPGFPRVGRRAGAYTDIFGESQTSTGTAAGINLEKLAEEGELPSSFLPKPPSHAIRRAVRELMNGPFQIIVIRALNEIPWGSFFVCTKD